MRASWRFRSCRWACSAWAELRASWVTCGCSFFISAVSLVKPGKSVLEVDAKSVRKRMKDKAFARSVSRQDIEDGARELGLELDDHIAFCIQAMRDRAGDLGLAGNPTQG